MLRDVSWLKIVHLTAQKLLRMPGLAHFLNVLGFTKTSGKQSSYCTESLRQNRRKTGEGLDGLSLKAYKASCIAQLPE